MSYCKHCDKETESLQNKFKDIVYAEDEECLTVYVFSCAECGAHKDNESYVGD